MPRFTLPRESFIPKGAIKIADKASDAVAYLTESASGVPYAMVFFGKQAKPVSNYRFRDRTARERHVREMFERRRSHEQYIAEQRDARKTAAPVSENGYIHTPQAAVMVRAALKSAFPGVKFSVRSESYSMGSHLRIGWTDGPTKAEIAMLVNPYSGSRFDGMIDMSYSVNSWLLPDGSVVYAGTSGTEGSRGSVPADQVDKPHPDAKLVKFLGSTPSLDREISPQFEAKCAATWDGMTGQEQCDLLNHGHMPRWEDVAAGRRLAEITAG